MHATHVLRCPVTLTKQDIFSVLERLATKGEFTPVAFTAKKSIISAAGISPIDLSLLPGTPDAFEYVYQEDAPEKIGDVFFCGEDSYVLSASVNHDVSVAAICDSAKPEDVKKKAELFAEEIKQAIATCVDGRKFRHFQFDWKEVRYSKEKLDAIKGKRTPDSANATFSPAALDNQSTCGADILANNKNRDTILSIAKAGFARQRDMLNARPTAEQEATQAAIQALKSAGLVDIKYLLECKKDQSQLARFDSKSDISTGTLRCPTCNNLFSEELISEGYSLSTLGKSLIQKSHWMTVWVTQRLVETGVPQESILWNLSEGGEEVDIVLDVLGNIWILELKDREFGPGDAHPFNYRQVRYDSSRAIIITTEKISKEAKRVFGELARAASRKRSAIPVYIEGLDMAGEKLLKLVGDAHSSRAYRTLVRAASAGGFDMSNLLKRRLAIKDGSDDDPTL